MEFKLSYLNDAGRLLLDSELASVEVRLVKLSQEESALDLLFLAGEYKLRLQALAVNLFADLLAIAPSAHKLVLLSSGSSFFNELNTEYLMAYPHKFSESGFVMRLYRSSYLNMIHHGFSVGHLGAGHLWLLKRNGRLKKSSYGLHLEGDMARLLTETLLNFEQLEILKIEQ